MPLNRQAAAKALQLMEVLAADTVMLTPKKERWIAEQRYRAERLMADNTVALQQKLRTQAVLVQKQVEAYTALAAP